MRFYDPDSGEVRLEGRNIAEANRSSVRRSYTMVLQDTWLFSGTIADNIAYGSPRPVSREEIEGVGFEWGDLEEMVRRYDPSSLSDGWNRMADGEEIYYISNPALGLWAYPERFKD